MADLDELERLHAEAVTNKGGDFEVDCDEALRLAAMEHLPALIAELRALREVRDAVKPVVEAYDIQHSVRCELIDSSAGAQPSSERVCTCWLWGVEAALEAAYDAAKAKEAGRG